MAELVGCLERRLGFIDFWHGGESVALYVERGGDAKPPWTADCRGLPAWGRWSTAVG